MEEGFFFFRNVEISSFFSTSHSNLFFLRVSSFLRDQLLKLFKERVVYLQNVQKDFKF